MTPIRERIASALLGPEKARLEETTKKLYQAYLEGPYLMTPDVLLSQLREVDSALLQDFVNQIGFEVIGTVGYGTLEGSEGERLRSVDESRRLYRYDVITQWVIWIWTNFGFGENVTITPEDEKAQEPWNEFWEADRNQGLLADDSLQFLSEDLLVDGEKFLLFFVSTLDGLCTLREMDTKEVTQIVTHPDDKETKLFYKRGYTDPKGNFKELYYPDYLAYITGALDEETVDSSGNAVNVADSVLPRGATRADTYKENTVVLCLHVAHNRKGGERGWPLMSAGAPWSRAHKKFREDRAAVSSAIAMFVRKMKVKGGSRAVETMRRQLNTALSSTNSLETNPPAVAGSTWLENDSAELSNMNLGTSAGDAKTDGESLLLMAGLGGGVYPHWMGAGDAYRLATASSMESPMYREFSRYQKFWASQFRRMVRIVLWAQETYNRQTYKTMDADVSTDKLLQTDLTQLVGGLSQAISGLLVPFKDSLPPDTPKKLLATSWQLVLQTLGVSDADDLTSEDAFGVGIEPEPAPAPVVVAQPAVSPEGTPAVPEIPPEATPAEKAAIIAGWIRNIHEVVVGLREKVSSNGHKSLEEEDMQINVNVPAPQVHLTLPDGRSLDWVDPATVKEAPPEIHIHVPEAKPPTVTVIVPDQQPIINLPDQAAPTVTVIVPDQSPTVNVNLPEGVQEQDFAPLVSAPKVKTSHETQTVRRDPVTHEIVGTDSQTDYTYEE